MPMDSKTESRSEQNITESGVSGISQKDENVTKTQGSRVGFYLGVSNVLYIVLLLGIINASSVFFLQFQMTLDLTTAKTTTIYSFFFLFFFVGGPLYSAFLKIFGPRTTLVTAGILNAVGYIGTSQAQSYGAVVLCYDVLRGVGGGMALMGSYSINGQAFKYSLAFANNFINAGGSIVGAFYGPLFQLGIEYYTWRGVMLLTGAVTLNMVPMGWLTANFYKQKVNSTLRQTLSPTNTCNFLSSSFDMHLLKDPIFIIFIVATCGTQAAIILMMIYIVRYSQSIGISDQASSLFITMYQVSYITCCLLSGIILSNIAARAAKRGKPSPVKTSTILCIAYAGVAVIVYIPIIWETYEGYAVYVVLAGILTGTCGALPVTIVSEIFDKNRVISILGFRGFFLGIVMTSVPPLLGLIIDSVGSFKPVMYAISIFAVIGSLNFKLVQVKVDKRDAIEDLKMVA